MRTLLVRRSSIVFPVLIIGLLLAGVLVVARERVSNAQVGPTIQSYLAPAGATCGAPPVIVGSIDPRAVATDKAGNLFIGEATKIVRVDKASGTVSTLASGFDRIQELAIGADGALFVLEGPDDIEGQLVPPRLVKRIDPVTEAVSVVFPLFPPAGPDQEFTNGPESIAVGPDNSLYIGAHYQVGRSQPQGDGTYGEAQTVAGIGFPGDHGDGGAATNAAFASVSGLAVTGDGDVLVADRTNREIRRFRPGGNIWHHGGGASIPDLDYPLPAGSAVIRGENLAADGSGNLFIVEPVRHMVSQLDPPGGQQQIDTVIGDGQGGDSCLGDGGPAKSAQVNLAEDQGSGIDIDPSTGDLYLADGGNNRIRRVRNATAPFTSFKGVGPGAAPTADFTFSPETPTAGQPVQFTDASSGSPTSWQWSFGDGATSNQANPIHAFASQGLYQVSLTVSNDSGPSTPVTKAVFVSGAGNGDSGYMGITPKRVYDSRIGAPLGAGQSVTVDVLAKLASLTPADVDAVVLNVTGIGPTSWTWLTVHPADSPRPTASNVNLAPGQVLPNSVVAKLSPDGKVKVFNAAGNTHVAVDLMGYFEAGSDYSEMTPKRILDTRPSSAPDNGDDGAIGAGQGKVVQIADRFGIPADAGAVVMNVTAVAPTAGGFLSVQPGDVAGFGVSNLNFSPGETIANLVIVKLDDQGRARFSNWAGNTHVLADALGWLPESASSVVGLTPERFLDTRVGVGAPAQKVGQGQTVSLQVAGEGSVPPGAAAVVLNVTAVNVSSPSWVTVYPSGEALPGTSNLNLAPGDTVPNLVLVKLGGDGKVNLRNAFGSTDLLVDVMGFMPA